MNGTITGIIKVSWLCSTLGACDWKFVQTVINVCVAVGQKTILNVGACVVGIVYRH